MLAIIIPYYKLSFFNETLQSLSNQSDKRFKVYIGNDDSPESPERLLDKYKSKFNFKYHKFESNLGGISLVKQWERCIALTENEEWLMVLGDDDFISSNFVEEFYKNLDEVNSLNIKVIHYAVNVININENTSEFYKHPKIEKATDSFFRKYFNYSHGSLSEQIFSKNAYLKKRFRDIPLAWCADDLAWLDFSDFGNIFGINNAFTSFRISSENISRPGYNSELKKEAKYSVFKILVRECLYKFNKNQRLMLILQYEKVLHRLNKMTLLKWLEICKLFYFEKEYGYIKKSSKKYLKYLLKKI